MVRVHVVAAAPLFKQVGGVILSRWLHYLAGVTWIGLLYYFNFVQAPAFAELEAGSRTDAVSKLVPRALWWFRWGAALTLLSGLMILGFQEQYKGEYFKSPSGTSILTGALMATIMFLNVWLVIWPNQKIVIASAQRVAAGGEADPNATAAGRRGTLASRTNTLLSIPMLFFMGGTSHFFGGYFDTSDKKLIYWIITIVLVGLIELNGLGLIGGTGPGPTKVPLEKHRNTIISGFVLWAIFMVLWQVLFT